MEWLFAAAEKIFIFISVLQHKFYRRWQKTRDNSYFSTLKYQYENFAGIWEGEPKIPLRRLFPYTEHTHFKVRLPWMK